MFRALAKLILIKWMGWRIQGAFPAAIPKYIVIVAPHTSNWDFFIGVLGRSITRMGFARYLGKKELFRAPFGWFFRALGGYPVDRSRHTNLVDAIVEIFDQHDDFVIALAPEGTRKKVDKFKTGFYFIAKKAEIPIVKVAFDYKKKLILIEPPFYPTENFETDMDNIMSSYRSITGKKTRRMI